MSDALASTRSTKVSGWHAADYRLNNEGEGVR